ncbi:coiled-coil domain-containing protein [Campylobacter lanienae]|uniref:hypothetical protein n=1 Tax=Campylobacter lanienae TaxID=75658 RepID=UPI0021C2536A|nr:hypothetical protein [Campylobacter lanienae]
MKKIKNIFFDEDDDEWKIKRVRIYYQKDNFTRYVKYKSKIAKACINFAISKPYIFNHNTRDELEKFEAKYTFKEFEKWNEYSCSANEANTKFKELYDEAYDNYFARTKQKIQTKNLRVSAVVNINENHTLQDLKELANKIEQKYGIQPIQIVIHRDEGHYLKDINGEYLKDENNDFIFDPNLHAHIEFFTLDKEGINRYKSKDRYKIHKELQTLVADELGMERGKDYAMLNERPSQHLNRQEYAKNKAIAERKALKQQQQLQTVKIQQKNEIINTFDEALQIDTSKNTIQEALQIQKEQISHTIQENSNLKAELAKLKDINEINKELREQLKQSGANRADYAKLEQEVNLYRQKIRDKEFITKDELDKFKLDYLNELNEKTAKISELENENKTIKRENQELQSQILELNNALNEMKDEFNLNRVRVIQKLPQEMKDRLFLENLKRDYSYNGGDYIFDENQKKEFVEVAKRYGNDLKECDFKYLFSTKIGEESAYHLKHDKAQKVIEAINLATNNITIKELNERIDNDTKNLIDKKTIFAKKYLELRKAWYGNEDSNQKELTANHIDNIINAYQIERRKANELEQKLQHTNQQNKNYTLSRF